MRAGAHHHRLRHSGRSRLGRRAVIGGVLAALGLMLGCASGLGSFGPGDVARATAAPARSLFELFDRRSPGARTEAELTKKSLLSSELRSPVPGAGIRPESPTLVEALAPAPPAYLPAEIANLDSEASVLAPGFSSEEPATAHLTTDEGSSIAATLGGSSGNGGGGGNPPTDPPAARVPAVPEPGTWFTAIIGFGVLGWRLRRTHQGLRTTQS